LQGAFRDGLFDIVAMALGPRLRGMTMLQRDGRMATACHIADPVETI